MCFVHLAGSPWLRALWDLKHESAALNYSDQFGAVAISDWTTGHSQPHSRRSQCRERKLRAIANCIKDFELHLVGCRWRCAAVSQLALTGEGSGLRMLLNSKAKR